MKNETDNGYVYFMRFFIPPIHPSGDENEDWSADRAYLKVGFSRSPRARLPALLTASPFDIEIEMVLPGTEADELDIHKRLAAHRVKREWFHYSAEVGEFIEDMVDAEIMLKVERGDDYQPTVRECLDYKEPAQAFNAWSQKAVVVEFEI